MSAAKQADKVVRPPSDRGQGRKPIPQEDRKLVGSLRLSQAQWDKFERLGGVDWLRVRIERASEPA